MKKLTFVLGVVVVIIMLAWSSKSQAIGDLSLIHI